MDNVFTKCKVNDCSKYTNRLRDKNSYIFLIKTIYLPYKKENVSKNRVNTNSTVPPGEFTAPDFVPRNPPPTQNLLLTPSILG